MFEWRRSREHFQLLNKESDTREKERDPTGAMKIIKNGSVDVPYMILPPPTDKIWGFWFSL